MAVYRADAHDANRFYQMLSTLGYRLTSSATALHTPSTSGDSNRPDIPQLAKAAGRSGRLVHVLEDLEWTDQLTSVDDDVY